MDVDAIQHIAGQIDRRDLTSSNFFGDCLDRLKMKLGHFGEFPKVSHQVDKEFGNGYISMNTHTIPLAIIWYQFVRKITLSHKKKRNNAMR